MPFRATTSPRTRPDCPRARRHSRSRAGWTVADDHRRGRHSGRPPADGDCGSLAPRASRRRSHAGPPPDELARVLGSDPGRLVRAGALLHRPARPRRRPSRMARLLRRNRRRGPRAADLRLRSRVAGQPVENTPGTLHAHGRCEAAAHGPRRSVRRLRARRRDRVELRRIDSCSPSARDGRGRSCSTPTASARR